MIRIGNGPVQIEVLEPYTEYTGVRFDHMGFIRQIYYDGTPLLGEYYEDTFVGAGLCNEFGITAAVGYKPNKVFPKIGVGLLVGSGSTYDFMKNYVCKPFDYEIERESGGLIFRSYPRDCGGYAFLYEKRIKAAEDIQIWYTLKNVGKKTIITDEYTHNFLPQYGPYRIETPVLDQGAAHGGIYGTAPCSQPEIKRYTPIAQKGFFWKVKNEQRILISETAGFPPVDFAVWKSGMLVSPEIFCRIHVSPGQTQQWSRTYQIGMG